uniref:Ciliary neurotrophic factor n=1 Tax=Astatotilapia calliptera TaxID=8154 RepID=A0A3P8PK45_ASTCA
MKLSCCEWHYTTTHYSSEMAVWKALFLLFCILDCMEQSASLPVAQTNSLYLNCFKHTRSTRTRVQQLLGKYKEQQLGNGQFEDRSRHLKDLPSLSTEFYRWINLTEWERLHAAFWDMKTYWNMLEWKRIQLENEEKDQKMVQDARTTLTRNIRHIQLDLRDLISQVSTQMSSLRSSWKRPAAALAQTRLNPASRSRTVWDSRVEGYIILRDLDLYLTKLGLFFKEKGGKV